MASFDSLPPEVRQAFTRMLAAFRDCSATSWIAVVGGAARDLVRGHSPGDFDVAVGGIPEKSVTPIMRFLFPGRVRGVGRTHPVIKLRVDRSETERWEVDVTWEHADALTPELWADLARRRDLTINSMAFPFHEGGHSLFDPFGGARDVAERRLRAVAENSFEIDPLRVYRAAQMVARFDLEADPQTEEWIRRVVDGGRLDDLPRERVTQEWKSLLLRAERPSRGLEKLRQWGVLARLNAELSRLSGTPQDRRWHPEGDVWVHTLMVVDQAARLMRALDPPPTPVEREAIMFGALCHDLGKPYTTVVQGEAVTAYGHEAAGVIPTQSWLSRLSLSNDVCTTVLTCVEQHMRPGSLARCIDAGELSTRQQVNVTRRLVRDVSSSAWRPFLTVCEADRRGRGFPGAASEPYRPAELLNAILNADPSTTEPLLRGRDLLALGHPAGRALGPILKGLEKARDQGLISTRDEALEWVRQNFPLRRARGAASGVSGATPES